MRRPSSARGMCVPLRLVLGGHQVWAVTQRGPTSFPHPAFWSSTIQPPGGQVNAVPPAARPAVGLLTMVNTGLSTTAGSTTMLWRYFISRTLTRPRHSSPRCTEKHTRIGYGAF